MKESLAFLSQSAEPGLQVAYNATHQPVVIPISQEQRWLQAAANGCSESFSKLYLQYYEPMKRMLQVFTDDQSVIEDQVQDAFVKLWGKKEQLAKIQCFKSYAFLTLRNGFISEKRKQIVHQKFQSNYTPTQFVQAADDLQYEAKELQEQIHACLLQISPSLRAVFLLSRYKGYDNPEIAATLQLSKRTVKNHLVKAKKQLRELMAASIAQG